MSNDSITIPPETARHVLWMFGHGGYRPGSFTQKLLDLLAHADRAQAAKLATIYPAEAEAVRLAKYDEDGIDRLKAAASIRCLRCPDTDGPFTASGLCEACARPLPLAGAM